MTDSWSWDRSRVERELATIEKELRLLKTKLDNSIIDIRAVNYWDWTTAESRYGMSFVTKFNISVKVRQSGFRFQ